MGWFVKLIAWIAVAVMVFFVIAIIIFGPAAVFPWSPGAVASATHANVSKNGTQEYSLVAENLSFVQAAISGAVTNITGENFSQTQAVISGMVTNVTGGPEPLRVFDLRCCGQWNKRERTSNTSRDLRCGSQCDRRVTGCCSHFMSMMHFSPRRC